MVVTAPQCKTSWGVYKRFRLQGPLSLQFWQMDQLFHGAIQFRVVTVQKSKISWGMCVRFRAHVVHLLRFWQMDLLFLGAILSRSVEPSVARVCAECKSAFFFVLNDLIYCIHRSCDFWKVQLSQVHLGDLQALKFCGGHVDDPSFLDVD